MARHGSIAEQLAAQLAAPPKPKAANDNKPARYRGTLPALRWLWDNHPELAPALAEAIPRPAANWFVDVEPSRQEIRPTIGELMAASHDEDGNVLPQRATAKGVTLGTLVFRNGTLVEWGVTAKGRKLKPKDRPRTSKDASTVSRNPDFYLKTKANTPSPFDAAHYHRSISELPALPPMYDPLPGARAGREFLKRLGVDGSRKASEINAKVMQTVVAAGAGFIGGVSSPSGNGSSGAVAWEAPEDRKSDAAVIIEEVAAKGTLKSIGIRLGYSEDYADRAGKAALVEVAKILDCVKKSQKS